MKTLIFSLLVLVGCAPGHAPNMDSFEYKGFHFSSEVLLDGPTRERITYDIELAKTMLDARGLISAGDFDSGFRDVNVEIYYGQSVSWGSGSQPEAGQYSVAPNIISITEAGGALLHELLHKWDWEHFAIGTESHAHWHTNGYYAADDAFVAAHHNWTCNVSDYTSDGYFINSCSGRHYKP